MNLAPMQIEHVIKDEIRQRMISQGFARIEIIDELIAQKTIDELMSML